MKVENRAGSAPSGRSSRDTLAYDPITILLEMAQGLDIYRSALPATSGKVGLSNTRPSARLRAERQQERR